MFAIAFVAVGCTMPENSFTGLVLGSGCLAVLCALASVALLVVSRAESRAHPHP